jgi:hypothetical protein
VNKGVSGRTKLSVIRVCDIFVLAPQFCRSDIKSSVWMEIRDRDGEQTCGRLEGRKVIKTTQVTIV